MKRIWIATMFAAASWIASADTIFELMTSAAHVNPAWDIAVAKYEIALFRYESHIATAVNREQIASIERNRLLAAREYRTDLDSFCDEVIDALFA